MSTIFLGKMNKHKLCQSSYLVRDRAASAGGHHMEDLWRSSLRGRRGLRDRELGSGSPRVSRTRYSSETETIFEEKQDDVKEEKKENN